MRLQRHQRDKLMNKEVVFCRNVNQRAHCKLEQIIALHEYYDEHFALQVTN